ncbi:MAG: hypothetical protein KDI74_04595 [Gammaproteobacteria bacterium]|nr:hypothetical protein [Gammaproteobacteria bacterium]
MKKIRWNKRYLTGDSGLDDRNLALVALLSSLQDELRSKEHCQEINELTARLTDLVQQRLSGDPRRSAESEATIRNLLQHEYPLAAVSTPACRKCGLCELEAERIAAWLSPESEKRQRAPT